MTPFHLVADTVQDVVERELAGFFSHPGVKHDLELQIAELVRQGVHVVTGDRVRNFVRFLDRVGRDRRECLHAIPFAARGRIAETLHDFDEALKAQEGFSTITIRLNPKV
jgi:hypothetical protein